MAGANRLVKWCKNVFLYHLPNCKKDLFAESCTYTNNISFIALPVLNIFIQIFSYYTYLYIYPTGYPSLPAPESGVLNIFTLVYISVNVLFLILFILNRKHEGSPGFVNRSHILAIVFLLSYVMLEGADMLMEISVSGNLYRFIWAFFATALLPLLPRLEKFFILAALTAVVEIGFGVLIWENHLYDTSFQLITLILLVVCVFVSNLLYSSKIRSFLSEQKILDENAELMEANENLVHLSNTDPLTKLANMRAFSATIDRIWRESKRTGQIISLLMIDIDWFKNYNDNYGHQKGDECLVAVSNCIRKFLKRSTDMVARYGGEEFVVLLPFTLQRDAISLGNRIRLRVANLHIPNKNTSGEDHITVSVGVASMAPGIDDDYAELIALADDALYAAKHQGKNRVCAASSGSR